MKFPIPIFILKQQAKRLSRQERIPLHEALDRIARREGFADWGLLASRWSTQAGTSSLSAQLRVGELVLLAARPGQGKTLLSLRLAMEWMARGHRAAFFTLEFTRADAARCFRMLDGDIARFGHSFLFDDSDDITARYIVERLGADARNMLVVVDYLQVLDQRRDNPSLMHQVRQLRDFARHHQTAVLCLSQVHRLFDSTPAEFPALSDIRLPNPLDLTLFDKACFLNEGRVRMSPLS
jgi:replicative DNA helicase